VGLNFADVTEAENFFAVVEEKISQRNNRFGITNKYVLAQYFVSNVLPIQHKHTQGYKDNLLKRLIENILHAFLL